MRYFVDKRIMSIVPETELDFNFLPPELYYEYLDNGSEDIIVETWECSPTERISFSYLISEKRQKGFNLEMSRQNLFEEHNCKPYRLFSYAVPHSWYVKATEKIQ